ncbi:hypothetical protein KFK09_003959 [Dendrobium nobile]|uniref:Acid phosphatase/vanadium-dependent haloperoxidase-related protein n=1 Tax=Dendrobium nobile TaxID=94219 RepID=A0A8T3BZ04_DENNO|nr:hypothetical protein KFK09_003959 [Dendrobium nobile]
MVRMADTGASSTPSSSLSFNSSSVFHNYPLISALVAFSLAQSIKFFTIWYREKRWDPKQLIGSGGMPSSHSGTVASLAIAIGIQDGFNSSLFAASMIFASVVLNQIVFELPAEHPLAETRPLRELLGHTPAQVIFKILLREASSMIQS